MAVYTIGAITLLWLSSSLVGAINKVPLVRHHSSVFVVVKQGLDGDLDVDT